MLQKLSELVQTWKKTLARNNDRSIRLHHGSISDHNSSINKNNIISTTTKNNITIAEYNHIKVLSMNIWFENILLYERADAILDLIRSKSPDIILFQELTVSTFRYFMEKLVHNASSESHYVTPFQIFAGFSESGRFYGECIFVRKGIHIVVRGSLKDGLQSESDLIATDDTKESSESLWYPFENSQQNRGLSVVEIQVPLEKKERDDQENHDEDKVEREAEEQERDDHDDKVQEMQDNISDMIDVNVKRNAHPPAELKSCPQHSLENQQEQHRHQYQEREQCQRLAHILVATTHLESLPENRAARLLQLKYSMHVLNRRLRPIQRIKEGYLCGHRPSLDGWILGGDMNISPGGESETIAELLSTQYPNVKDAWREGGADSNMEVTWDPFVNTLIQPRYRNEGKCRLDRFLSSSSGNGRLIPVHFELVGM